MYEEYFGPESQEDPAEVMSVRRAKPRPKAKAPRPAKALKPGRTRIACRRNKRRR